MACAGIDFGAKTAVVAIARRGGIDICCNEVSNRATPTIVSFLNDERHIGESAASIAAQNPKNTAAYLQRLLGVPHDTEFAAQEAKRITCQVLPDPTTGACSAKVSYTGIDSPTAGEHVFPFEALTGMLLTNLMASASGEYKAPVKDLVISVPTYYTEGQRRALLNAATIADFNVLRVVNEHAAIALSYGIFRTKQLPEKDPIKVAFVDIGEASTTVSITAFTNTRCDVISVVTDHQLGGRDLDDLLVTKFAAEIKSKYSIDVLSKPKPAARLRKDCEKLKKVLSTNSQAPLNIECIMNDVDIRSSATREDFEKLSVPVVERVRVVCERALKAAKLKEGEKLFAVEIVGGSTRVPAFKSVISEVFSSVGAGLSSTLNADECISRGCALLSAMLSPAFRVRDYVVNDINTQALDAEKIFTDGTKPEKVTLVPVGNVIPCLKAMTFKSPGPLTINVRYKEPETLPFGAKDPQLLAYLVDAPQDPEAKVRTKIRVTANGIVEMASAQLMKEVEVEEDIVVKTPENAPESSQNGAIPTDVEMSDKQKDAGKKDAEMTDSPASSTKPDVAPIPKETDGKPAEGKVEQNKARPPAPVSAPVADASKPPTVQKRKVKKMKTTNLQFTPLPGMGCLLTSELVAAAADKEARMRANDSYMKERSEAMNSLEAYVYDLRSRIDDYGDLKDFGPKKLRKELKADLGKAEDWIYSDEGDKASKSAFAERKALLEKKAKPLFFRKKEFDERPVRIKVLEASIDKYKKILVPGVEEYAHIDDKSKGVAQKCLESASVCLAQEVKKQDKLSKEVDPILTCESLSAKLSEVDKVCQPIMSTPKPKPKEEEKKPEEKKPEEKKPEEKKAEEKADANLDKGPVKGTAKANGEDGTGAVPQGDQKDPAAAGATPGKMEGDQLPKATKSGQQ